jgi:HSP20 family protein
MLTYFVRPRNRLDSVFERLATAPLPRGNVSQTSVPLSVWEDDDHYHVEIELPGVAEADVEVVIHQDVLTIKGERKRPADRRDLVNTRNFGRFEQTVTFHEAIDAGSVRADLDHGVLHITCAKRGDNKPRRIAIKND